MQTCRVAAALAATLGLAACTPPADAPAAGDTASAVPAAAAPVTSFAPKARIPVRLTLKPSDQGGRVAPISGGYRPVVVFAADGTRTPCGIDRREVGQFAPGERHEVGMRCADAVNVRMDALGFSVMEDGREIGSGVVLP